MLVDGIDHGRSKFLTGKTVAAADDGEIGAVGESGFDVEVKRFTETAGFFGAVENGDLFATGRESGLDMFDREGTIQTDFDKTDFFAFGDEVIESFFDGFAAGTHGDDDFISIGGTDIVEEVHRTAGQAGDLIHVFLDDTGQIEVDLVGGFAALEVDIRVLGSHFGIGSFRTESALTETFDIFHIDEALHISIVEKFDLLEFVRGTETVEEAEEGDFAFEGREVGDDGEVVGFLNAVGTGHGKTGSAAGHNVGVVTEDGE